ncbi:MAG TPA: hypothetical protein VFW83_02285, partial [Bryobacteraceae bacterium]|nr:hypothetical protein [Bryobacteraceae bacterium]
SSAYIDVALGAIVFSVFYWLQIWDESGDSAALIPVGLLAGYAYAAKYTAFVMLPFALGFVLWRARKLRPLILVAGLACVTIAPWMLKDWFFLHDPIAPFGNQVFRNPNFHVISERDYAAYFRRYELSDLRQIPLEAAIHGGKLQGILGAAFLAAPLALLALRQQAGRRLLAAAAVLLIPYFGNIGTRFLIPLLPFVSLAMALALSTAPALLAVLMIFHAVSSWPSVMTRYVSPNSWGLEGMLFNEALRIVPQEQYLRENFPAYGVARLIDANVPDGERVLSFGSVWDAYTSRDVLVTFQGAFNETLADILSTGWIEGRQPRVLETFSFPERPVRRLRVVQTASPRPDQQWSIHELRFYDRGRELPREPQWRLRAWPNPWDVQLAFDNSAATRWRSWEPAAPGMYMDADFGQNRGIDEVRVETSYDSFKAHMELEEMDATGHWSAIAQNPKISFVEPRGSMRLAATYEMNARGIHYLLVSNSEFGADDFREDPEAWGLIPVAQGYGVRLYRVSERR